MQYYINDNELIDFNYGEISSTSFFLYVTNIQGLNDSFERDIEFLEIKGRDGELPIDNQRRKSKDIILEAFIDLESSTTNLEILATEIENWLQADIAYKDLIFSNSNKVHKAICINKISISEIIEDLAEVQIKFKIQPD